MIHSKKPKLLLTGASGFLGSVLLDSLAGKYEVVGCAHSQGGAQFHLCDLTDATAVKSLMREVQPDVVVHTAALTNVDVCEKEANQAFRLNVEATRYLSSFAMELAAPAKFVYISTDQVYDGQGPHVESDIAPNNVYALTKLWGEECVRQIPNSVVLRTNFFGFSSRGPAGLIKAVIDAAHSSRGMTLFTDVLFSPLFIGHLSNIIVDVLDQDIEGVYNAGASGGGVTKAGFVRSVIRRLNLSEANFKDGVLDDVELFARRPRDMRMDSKKLSSALGCQFPSIEDGLQCLVDTL